MNKIIFSRRFWLMFFFSSVLFMQSTNAFARPGEGGFGGPRGGYPSDLRRGHEEFLVGHERYRYHDGRFFRLVFGFLEVVVDIPPAGLIVTTLPVRHRTIIAGGVTYYYYNNVYYTVCPSGYIVVPAPVVSQNIITVPSLVVSDIIVQPKNISGERILINIPNSNGSFAPVILTKQKDGYVGPQGEYYAGHPTIEQLKVLYGK